MQTFLPEPTFKASVSVLDSKRLNKQLLECRQMLDAIGKTPAGAGMRVDGKIPFASNHPVTNMYRGYEDYLVSYAAQCASEMSSRGMNFHKNWDFLRQTYIDNEFMHKSVHLVPHWAAGTSFERIMLTHRASLYRKDPKHYPQYREDSTALDATQDAVVCCPDKVRAGRHAPYYYPTH